MSKIKVLFVCVHNSARSQMAEAYLNDLAGDRFESESAGLEPGRLNPMVVEAMKKDGLDISGNTTKSVFDIFRNEKKFDYIISVCDEANAERCPFFPGAISFMNWSFPDPSTLPGSGEEQLSEIMKIRDSIKTRIKEWLTEVS